MHILVTAGNTLALIDKVRCLTNIFSGRTGAAIALEAHGRGHRVTLLTSQAEVIATPPTDDRWILRRYRTFEELQQRMETLIPGGDIDAIIHCAAVSDYLGAGVYSMSAGTTFDPQSTSWQGKGEMIDRAAGKIKSDEPELWIRLVRAPKLVDRIRSDWRFTKVLVKFKLEVGISDEQLLDIAEKSRQHSQADLMVANTLESAPLCAWLGSCNGEYIRLQRRDLASRLLDAVEQLGSDR
jgi:phosphopantothenoylcysteine synthetase/decarboxylase